jgi:hypothetical protein
LRKYRSELRSAGCAKQPEKIEVRQAVAADVNGTIYMAQKQRGGKCRYMAGPYGTPQAIGGDCWST